MHERVSGAPALKTFGTCFGICDDVLGLLARSGEDLLGLTLCVSDRLVRGLLRELQDLGRLADLE
jgi:hypothetical protein